MFFLVLFFSLFTYAMFEDALEDNTTSETLTPDDLYKKLADITIRANNVLKKVDDAVSKIPNAREKIMNILEFHPIVEEANGYILKSTVIPGAVSANKLKRCQSVYATAKKMTTEYFFKILSNSLKDNFMAFKKVLLFHINMNYDLKSLINKTNGMYDTCKMISYSQCEVFTNLNNVVEETSVRFIELETSFDSGIMENSLNYWKIDKNINIKLEDSILKPIIKCLNALFNE